MSTSPKKEELVTVSKNFSTEGIHNLGDHRVKEYRIVYVIRVLYDYTRLSLVLDSLRLNVQRILKLSIQNENNVVEGKSCINRESKRDELTIWLYSFYGINMNLLAVVTPPSIYHGCSAREMFWEGKFTGKKSLFLAVNMKSCGRRNVREHKDVKGSDKYVTLDISSKFDSLDKIKITS